MVKGNIDTKSGFRQTRLLSNFRDESDLLLGFLAPPSEPLVQIPSRPTNQALGGMPSTRNKGVSWAWALLLEKSPRWFDISDMKILDSPPEIAGPELIDAYLGEIRHWPDEG